MPTPFDEIKREFSSSDYSIVKHKIIEALEELQMYSPLLENERAASEIRELFFEVENVGIESGHDEIIESIRNLYCKYMCDIECSGMNGKLKHVLCSFLNELNAQISLLEKLP